MKRILLTWITLFFVVTVFAALAPGLYEVNVSSTLNVRGAPAGDKIGSLSKGDVVQVVACEDGWAQVSLANGRTGYVSEQYLVPYSSPAASSGFSRSSISLRQLKHYAPFVILLFAILTGIGAYVDSKSLFFASYVLWGAAEMFMFYKGGGNSALVWFCDPSDVGWIWTVINFFVAIGVLYCQYFVYQQFVLNLFDGFWKRLFFGLFIIVGVILFLSIFEAAGTDWAYVIILTFAFMAYMALLLYICRPYGLGRSLAFTVFAFGLAISFLGMLSTMILAALLWLGLVVFAKSGEYKERYKLDDGTIVEGNGSDFTDIRTGERYIRDNMTGRFYLRD